MIKVGQVYEDANRKPSHLIITRIEEDIIYYNYIDELTVANGVKRHRRVFAKWLIEKSIYLQDAYLIKQEIQEVIDG